MINPYPYNYIFLEETDSTNNYLKNMLKHDFVHDFFCIRTAYQSAGRGQIGNIWESENNRNLLFSFVIRPENIAIDKQFIISQMISMAISESILKLIRRNFNPQLLKIKWPNDIYYGDKKLGGILIENSLKGSKIMSSVIGVGINVNQEVFTSDAPNPVSLRNITGNATRIMALMQNVINILKDILEQKTAEEINQYYLRNLYRYNEWHQYRADDKVFTARISDVKTDGALVLEIETGEIRHYYFKEVEFLIYP